MTAREDHYEGLGRLLRGAGVDAQRVEGLVLGAFTEQGKAAHELLARDMQGVVGAELAALRDQQRQVSGDAQRLMTRIRIDLEAYQRVLAKGYTTHNRMIVLILLMQIFLILAVFAAGILLPSMRPGLCETAAFVMSGTANPGDVRR